MDLKLYTAYFLLFLHAIYISPIYTVEIMRFANFKLVSSLRDYIITDSAIWVTSNVRSSSSCVLVCLEDTSCKSVFFKNLTMDCTGHSGVHTSTAMATHDPGTLYYVNLNSRDADESTTATAPETTETLPTTPPAPCAIYWGCFLDIAAKMFREDERTTHVNTHQYCAEFCREGNYKYAGMEYASTCFCGNSYDESTYVLKPDNECTTPCAGDSSQMCGGSSRRTVFKLSGCR